ncbi:putative terminase small subunit [Aeromonas phage Ahp2]|nr:putative terminase small subunit [Aeromonas phage Ahp2]
MSITGGDEPYKWTISAMARAFNLHRDTVRSRLNDAGVKPCGKKANAPLYLLAQAAEAIFAGSSVASDASDPSKLDPKSRKEWFQSENERLKYQTTVKDLIPSGEHRNNIAITVKGIASFFDSLPDKMERTRLFTPEQLEALEGVCDQQRNQLQNELMEYQE